MSKVNAKGNSNTISQHIPKSKKWIVQFLQTYTKVISNHKYKKLQCLHLLRFDWISPMEESLQVISFVYDQMHHNVSKHCLEEIIRNNRKQEFLRTCYVAPLVSTLFFRIWTRNCLEDNIFLSFFYYWIFFLPSLYRTGFYPLMLSPSNQKVL